MTLGDQRQDTSWPDANRELAAVIATDRAEWPLGHPCRNCGGLARYHPVKNPTITCEEWR